MIFPFAFFEISQRQPYLDAELLTYSDPLVFTPEEPRYKLVNLVR